MGTFLIADDTPGKILFLKSVLKHARWEGEVLTAMTTEEAKRVIDEHPEIVAAFVDYQIPTENGPAIIRYLKQNIPAAHIALTSSSDSDTYRANAKAAGAEASVCLSLAEEEILKQLTDLLQMWHMGQGD